MIDFDVEAVIVNCRESQNAFANGYRPDHLVHKEYLTTGEHYYPNVEKLNYGESTLGYIKFITPNFYPHCLWIGKKIPFQEGATITGYATITKILNKVLESENGKEAPLDYNAAQIQLKNR